MRNYNFVNILGRLLLLLTMTILLLLFLKNNRTFAY